ncbi:acetoacetate-CoA ligase [Deinococcus cellulosilyticus NBRC 106333 = KACC 11606]|uniref:Acetoacetate-CoA ligase n=1 Tax=Deinococcus cellulosilyticus (strain DSM 18568 / NBRC 106333 / KACC 11606 / 5516J-15) TaxID=1223518 RepID=A0A511N328_DEIC1|nr:acetoacetate-CoA ligase [Deinococcus cellulosilyticus NBRC 106333 = KACC 11606]
MHFQTYTDLNRFALERAEVFWPFLWNFVQIQAETRGERVLDETEGMMLSRFFPDARLNFTENVLRHSGPGEAIVEHAESGRRRSLSWDDLRKQVEKLSAYLRHAGVKPGDRVAAWIPNCIEAVITSLAAARIGAIYSSTSPDFGVDGVLDRFGQIEPVVLVAADGYTYNGKPQQCMGKLAEIVAGLPTVREVLVIGYQSETPDLSGLDRAKLFSAALENDLDIPEAQAFEFNHPLYILYSSGTTGKPKCIVHRAGGILLNHLKEHQLHCDIQAGDRVMYYTTTGWMMWNWLVTALASKATIVLYDGSPFQPGPERLFKIAEQEQLTFLGVSAKWIESLRKLELSPKSTYPLSALRTMASTGSPLSEEGFQYVYDHIKRDLHLSSISGGTDLCGCFLGGNPLAEVHPAELQVPMLGMSIEIYPEEGEALLGPTTGELVCTRPFPSQPLKFWNDPENKKYQAAYFERFPGVWHHGDFVQRTETGFKVLGRSDATLNPGGVRIGTAEIYRQVESFPEILEALVFMRSAQGEDQVVLLVRMKEEVSLTDDLRKQIQSRIRQACTPRHVPGRIEAVADLPRTKNGKLLELAVTDLANGRPVRNVTAVANPEALEAIQTLFS